jgi:hypothetical protein
MLFKPSEFPRRPLLGSSVNKGDGSLRIVLAQQRGPESSSSLGPRPSIDGLVVCALGLALAPEASSLLCGAPYVPDGDASIGAGVSIIDVLQTSPVLYQKLLSPVAVEVRCV